MRTLSPSQTASFQGDLLTICSLVEIYANDGSIVYLTDHDQDLSTYRSSFGLDVSAILMQLGGTGQTATISMLPDKDTKVGVTYPMIEGGLLDNALIKCYWADYNIAPLDPIQIFEGYVTQIVYGNSAVMQISVASKLSIPRPLCSDVLSQTCRADFGDSKCKVDAAALVDQPHVFAPIDAQSILMSRDEVTPPGFYNNGTMYFLNGANKGLGYEVLTVSLANEDARETIYLKVPLAFDVVMGDYFNLYPGCDKVITSGCTYWNNVVNFQGEPFIADASNILPAGSDVTIKASGLNTGLPTAVNFWLTQYIKVGFGKTIIFTAGTRAVDGAEQSQTTADKFFYGTELSDDAYNALFNILGGLDAILAFDGNLTPKDPDMAQACIDAGFQVPLQLTSAPVQIVNPGSGTNVEQAYLNNMFIAGSPAESAAYSAIGVDPATIPPPAKQTMVGMS